VPFAVECHGRFCKETVDFLQLAAEWGAGACAGSRRDFKGACLMPINNEIIFAPSGGDELIYLEFTKRLIYAQGRRFMRVAAVRVPIGRLSLSRSHTALVSVTGVVLFWMQVSPFGVGRFVRG
jgi:hypothetical protein